MCIVVHDEGNNGLAGASAFNLCLRLAVATGHTSTVSSILSQRQRGGVSGIDFAEGDYLCVRVIADFSLVRQV